MFCFIFLYSFFLDLASFSLYCKITLITNGWSKRKRNTAHSKPRGEGTRGWYCECGGHVVLSWPLERQRSRKEERKRSKQPRQLTLKCDIWHWHLRLRFDSKKAAAIRQLRYFWSPKKRKIAKTTRSRWDRSDSDTFQKIRWQWNTSESTHWERETAWNSN